MRRFVEVIDRGQATLFAECLADWIDEDKLMALSRNSTYRVRV